MEKVYFKINGEFITTHFRDICLEGRWNEAKIGLFESFSDNQEAEPYINKVLAGDMKIVGEARIGTDDSVSFEYDNDLKYKQQLSYSYMKNIVYINNKFYKIIACINTILKNSDNYIMDRARFYFPDIDAYCFVNDMFCVLKEKSSNDIPPFLISKFKEKNYINKNFKVILQGVIVYGITKDNCDTEVLQTNSMLDIIAYNKDRNNFNDSYHDTLNKTEINEYKDDQAFRDEVFYRRMLVDKINEENQKASIELIRVKIIEQANLNGGFLLIGKEDEEQFNVPKNAFLNWVCRMGYYDIDPILIPKWEPVSDRNMKMYGDSQYHTDFVIGAGYDPKDFYDNENFNTAAFSAMHEIRGLDMLTLSGEGIFKGKVIFVDKNTPVSDCVDKIIVTKTADIEIFKQAKVAKLVIVENGGPGSHLVVNSKEFKLNVILLKNAMFLSIKHEYTFNLDEDNYKVMEAICF